jgi:hypothetical protein
MARALKLAGFAGMLVLMHLAEPGRAEPIAQGGLTFSDELGGFRILKVTGIGSTDDPFVVVEEVTDGDGSILVIRGLSPNFGNKVGTQHLVGFALTKIVINGTPDTWRSYDVELRETLGSPSPYEDGLSFGQGSQQGRPFRSSRYAGSQETDEPFDSVMFTDGTIAPGESVAMQLVVTDTSPVPLFYVVQQQIQQVAWLQSPRGDGEGLAAPRAGRYVPPRIRPRSEGPLG